jgi:glycine hydroxymethyltransferase
LHLQTIAATAYALQNSQTPEFKALMKQVIKNARHFCEALKKRGFDIVTGGTDCHMFVADLRPFNADCTQIAQVMQDVGITVNTKSIPHDPSPNPGGLRAGTTVLTQRGMKEAEMEEVADIWLDIVKNPADPAKLADVQQRILSLARRFPLPE